MTLTEQMKADGWIEHDGLCTPAPNIRVRLRNGIEIVGPVTQFIWSHFKSGNDIIAYKPEQPQ